MPSLTNNWSNKGHDRSTQSFTLLSGITKGIEVEVDPQNQLTHTTMDISKSHMYHPEKYLKNFKHLEYGTEVATYGPNSGKMTTMMKAVMKVKGSSIHNTVLTKHTEHTGGLIAEMDPYVGDLGSENHVHRREKEPAGPCQH
jgi:hypothetical protein